jgi:hypothetical protein
MDGMRNRNGYPQVTAVAQEERQLRNCHGEYEQEAEAPKPACARSLCAMYQEQECGLGVLPTRCKDSAQIGGQLRN